VSRVHRLLLVVASDIPASELRRAVRSRVRGRSYELAVIAPSLVAEPKALGNGEWARWGRTRERLQRTIAVLAEAGLDARGAVTGDDPLQAIADVLAWFSADELVVVATDARHRSRRESDLEARARALFGLPVARFVLAGDVRREREREETAPQPARVSLERVVTRVGSSSPAPRA
jgi:hypothetical protein